MNRAEKTEPLPSCRGTHKGHPIRGDFMFSNKIPLGLLSEAYGLSMEECLELIGRVNVVSHTFNVPPSDVETTASRVTDKVLSDGQVSSPAFFLMCLTGWVAWREKNTQDELRNIFSNILRVIKSQKLEDARVCLYPLVLLLYVTDYQVDKEQVIKVLFQEGVPLKKEVKGLTYAVVDSILRRRGSSIPQEEKSPADEAIPHHKPNSAEQADTPAMMEDAAPVDGEKEQISDSMPTREEVLAEVLKWHMTEPGVFFIHVGLLRLQRKSNEEVYRIAWKCYGEKIPKDFGRSVRHQWERFLDYAEPKGMDRAMLNNMIS